MSETIDELAAKIAARLTVPVDQQVWTAEQCAQYLGFGLRQFRERISHRHGFPTPQALGSLTRWRASEIVAWKREHPDADLEPVPYRPRCGVYILFKAGAPVYVGQSLNVDYRLGQHRDKDFDAVQVIECDPTELIPLETRYINRLRPILNVRGVS